MPVITTYYGDLADRATRTTRLLASMTASFQNADIRQDLSQVNENALISVARYCEAIIADARHHNRMNGGGPGIERVEEEHYKHPVSLLSSMAQKALAYSPELTRWFNEKSDLFAETINKSRHLSGRTLSDEWQMAAMPDRVAMLKDISSVMMRCFSDNTLKFRRPPFSLTEKEGLRGGCTHVTEEKPKGLLKYFTPAREGRGVCLNEAHVLNDDIRDILYTFYHETTHFILGSLAELYNNNQCPSLTESGIQLQRDAKLQALANKSNAYIPSKIVTAYLEQPEEVLCCRQAEHLVHLHLNAT